MIRIVVVDDHPVVREGLVAILGDVRDFEVVGSSGSAEDLLPLAERVRPDIVLLDLELPHMDGVEAIERLAGLAPESRVIVFTAYDTDEKVVGALKAGAKGYLLKGAPAEDIGKAIRAVVAGGSYLEPRVAAKVLAEVRGQGRPATLTQREREVLRLIGIGQSNKQIARSLAISERTVKYHISSIMNKLGADNRAQAVALGAQKGLL